MQTSPPRTRTQATSSRAISLLKQSLADSERIFGPHHSETLLSRNSLAHAYRAANDLTRATPLYQQNLADCERILGPHHPHTLLSRNNLASAYFYAGDLARATPAP